MARGRGGTRRGGRGRGASRGGRGGTMEENNEASTSNPVNVVSDSDNDEESDNNDIANLNGDENGWTDNSGDNDGEGGSNQDNRRIRIVGIPDPPTLDNDSDDSDVDGEAPRRAPRTGRRLLLKNKAINCLEEAFNPVNYDRIEMPTGGDRKEVSALLTPKKTRPEVTITFRNYKVNNAGRPPR